MWHRFAFGEGGHPAFGRGDIKFIILDLLKDKPKHGYEILKDLEAEGSGFYAPSPGSVYPTLEMLEDLGYVVSKSDGGKKVYEITEEGRKYLAENQSTVKDIHERFGRILEHGSRHELRDIFHEQRELFVFLMQSARNGKLQRPDQVQQIKDVFSRARKEIEEIMNKPNA